MLNISPCHAQLFCPSTTKEGGSTKLPLLHDRSQESSGALESNISGNTYLFTNYSCSFQVGHVTCANEGLEQFLGHRNACMAEAGLTPKSLATALSPTRRRSTQGLSKPPTQELGESLLDVQTQEQLAENFSSNVTLICITFLTVGEFWCYRQLCQVRV